MSELITMRHRIKSVETIKKITHTMRLIAMSSHSKLRTKQVGLQSYKKDLKRILSLVKQPTQTNWNNVILHPLNNNGKQTLIILAGSQKGLCGMFNVQLLAFFEQHLQKFDTKDITLISIGKKIDDYIQAKNLTAIKHFKELTATSISTITKEIISQIKHANGNYRQVILFCNHPKTFFTQKPREVQLIPFDLPEVQALQGNEEYSYEQPAQEIIDDLAWRFLYSSIYELLLNSLIAEQAARFIAMDSSTRNATNLLDSMKLNYNKLRQTKITRELTDLIGSL